jgi:hypothetical protein
VLSLLVVLALGQTSASRGPVAVVIDSKRAGADAFSAKVATRVHSAIGNQGVDAPLDNDEAVKKLKAAGYSDPRNCQAGVACLGRLAKLLGPKGVVVGVDVAKIAKSLAVHLEAVSADGESLAVADLSGSADSWLAEMGTPIDSFVKQVADKVLGGGSSSSGSDLKQPQAQNDTKATGNGTSGSSGTSGTSGSGTVASTDPFIPPPPPPPAQEPEKKSRLVPLTLGVGAVVCLVASGVTLGLGMANKSSLDGSKVPGLISTSSLTQSQAMSYASTGNAEFTVSLITLVVGVLLAAGSAALFMF